MKAARLTVGLAIAIGTAVAVPAQSAPEPLAALGCRVPGQVTTDAAGWRHARIPDFGDGPRALTDVAVNTSLRGPFDAQRHPLAADAQVDVSATNGKTIVETRDSGCHWAGVWAPREVAGDVDIAGVRVGQWASATDSNRYTYAFGHESVGGVASRPFVAVGKATCSDYTACAATAGMGDDVTFLDGAGVPVDLAVSTDNAACAWLLTRPLVGSGAPTLLRTADGGTSWLPVATAVPIDRLVAHPTAGPPTTGSNVNATCDEVWGLSARGVYRSVDGGAHLQLVYTSPADISSAAVRQFYAIVAKGVLAVDAGHVEVDVFSRDRQWIALGGDGRPLGPARPTPGVGDSGTTMSVLSDQGVVAATDAGVYRMTATGTWSDISPAGRPLTQIAVDNQGIFDEISCTSLAHCGPCPAVPCYWPYTPVGHTDTELVVKATPYPYPLHAVGKVRAVYRAADATVRTLLTPPTTRLDLVVNQQRDVPFRFRLPWHPAAVDVDFDIDTTTSMDSVIQAVADGAGAMTAAFAQAGLDARVGVASIKDFDAVSVVPYKRVLRLAPPSPAFNAALAQLTPALGGGDPDEAQTFGLVQAVTGRGLNPDESAYGATVPPGGDAGFRTNAAHVIVLVTNSGSHEGGVHPDVRETVAQLRAHGVRVVTIFVTGGPQVDPFKAAAQLAKISGGSGALAPAGGFDCDGDGTADIDAGRPLVCAVGAESAMFRTMGRRLAAMVVAARPDTVAGLEVSGDVHLIRRFAGRTRAVFSGVNPGELDATGTFMCAAADAGRSFRVNVDATIFDASIAHSTVSIDCHARRPATSSLPPASEAVAAVPIVGAVGAAAAPVPPPPGNPVANSQPMPQPVSGLAAAAEDETQPVLATVRDDGRGAEAVLMSGLVMTCAALGWHRARRTRTAAQPARRRACSDRRSQPWRP